MITKSGAAIDAWAEVLQNAIREGAIFDVSGNYGHGVHIDLALTSEVAHTGSEIIIQISSSSGDDEFWSDFLKFIGPTGTANAENITDNPLAAASTTIAVASTTGYATKAAWRFIEDATIANSELIWQTGYTTDTNITILDGTKRSHVLNTPMYNIAGTYYVRLPEEAQRVRVIINNTYDPDGATLATRTRLSRITAI